MAKSVRKELAKRAADAANKTRVRVAEAEKVALRYVSTCDEIDRLSKEYLGLVQGKFGGLQGYDAVMQKIQKGQIGPDDAQYKTMAEVVRSTDRLGELKESTTPLERDLHRARKAAREALEEEEAAAQKLANYKEEKKEMVKDKKGYKEWKKRLRAELFGKD